VKKIELPMELRARDVVLAPVGDRLHYDAPKGALTPELRQALAEHKAELLAELAAEEADRRD